MSARRVSLVIGAVLALLAAVPAAADPVPGASYYGVASDGAGVTFTVSPDGTLITAYELRGVPGNGCQFYASGADGDWEGAPIAANSFDYRLGDAVVFQGTFTGAQTARGTFDLHHDATNGSAACDSGTVSWTATTTAKPPAGGGSSGSGGSGSGSSGSGGSGSGGSGTGGSGHHGPVFKTRVSLRKATVTELIGRITSPKGACRSGRTVYLWRLSRRIASTKSQAGGKFSFALKPQMKGRAVRASVPLDAVRAGACAAASSVFVKG